MSTEHRVSPAERRRFIQRRWSAMLLLCLLTLGLYRTIRS